MAEEIVSIFSDVPEGVFIDATVGLGGHLRAIKKRFPKKFDFVGIDRDGEMLEMASKGLPKDVRLFKMSFSEIPELLKREKFRPLTGILFDLGLNSMHLDNGSRGFSYKEAAPLDFRFDQESGKPLYEIIRNIKLPDLIKILKEYGQEKKSRAIAKAIIEKQPRTTDALASIVKIIVGPGRYIKAVSRIFQALRIFVNNELDEIEKAISGIIPRIAAGGRIAVISYHSLEDVIAKRQFKFFSGKCVCGPNVAQCECGAKKLIEIKTKKPIYPSREEIKNNSRARSARLRYAEKK